MDGNKCQDQVQYGTLNGLGRLIPNNMRIWGMDNLSIILKDQIKLQQN